MKHNRLIVVFFFAGMLLLSGCGGNDSSTSSEPSEPIETPAPVTHETRVITTSGETISVQVTTEGFRFPAYAGKPVVLEFYGDTCPHCRDAIPTYNQLENKYGDRLLILTINDGAQYTTLDNAGLQNFVNTYGIEYRTVSRENAGNIRAYAEELVGSMPGVPYVIVVNKEGVITAKMLGPNSAQLEASIMDVLQ